MSPSYSTCELHERSSFAPGESPLPFDAALASDQPRPVARSRSPGRPARPASAIRCCRREPRSDRPRSTRNSLPVFLQCRPARSDVACHALVNVLLDALNIPRPGPDLLPAGIVGRQVQHIGLAPVRGQVETQHALLRAAGYPGRGRHCRKTVVCPPVLSLGRREARQLHLERAIPQVREVVAVLDLDRAVEIRRQLAPCRCGSATRSP